MSYYAIGIGGTGAKCLEALVHLCAAGLLPNSKDGSGLYTLFVDPDKANGSLERASVTLQQYNKCKDGIDFGDSPAFQTKIEIANPDVWSPFTETLNPQLDRFFSKAGMVKPYQHLFDVLYTKKEQATSLELGFRGHPAIGAAVMAHTIDFDQEPWKKFKAMIQKDLNGGDGRIFLFGSIFGGTGASGLPTITELIYNQLNDMGMKTKSPNIKIGGAIMLPYFTFNTNNQEELQARAAEFLVNSQSALKYYYDKVVTKDMFDALYVLGNQSMQDVPHFNLGGKEQKNPPHFVELYAALAAIDFYSAGRDGQLGSVNLIARKGAVTDWGDIPEIINMPGAQKRLAAMTRCAFAYLCSEGYFDILGKIKNENVGINEPWYQDFIAGPLKGRKLADSDVWNSLVFVKEYLEMFLEWMASLHLESLALVDASAFADLKSGGAALRPKFDGDKFSDLILPTATGGNADDDLFALLERMCESKPSEFTGDAIGSFLAALYSRCYQG